MRIEALLLFPNEPVVRWSVDWRSQSHSSHCFLRPHGDHMTGCELQTSRVPHGCWLQSSLASQQENWFIYHKWQKLPRNCWLLIVISFLHPWMSSKDGVSDCDRTQSLRKKKGMLCQRHLPWFITANMLIYDSWQMTLLSRNPMHSDISKDVYTLMWIMKASNGSLVERIKLSTYLNFSVPLESEKFSNYLVLIMLLILRKNKFFEQQEAIEWWMNPISYNSLSQS